MRAIASILFILPLSLAACASTPGAQPHDMSVTHHEAMAASEERKADEHAAQYDSAARVEKERCGSGRSGTCWTSVVNPTEEHLREADRHRKMAADHRAASQVLRDAEASGCAGISDEDRDMSPFEHREDIESVTEILGPLAYGKSAPQAAHGALIMFRARPGMTEQWLQRVVDCHLARNAALGHSVPEMPYCPLVPKGVKATVSTTSTGFAIAVRAEDPDTAREVLRRAKTLVVTSGAPPATGADDKAGSLRP